MNTASSAIQREAWEQRVAPLLGALPYVLLALSAFLSVTGGGGPRTITLPTLTLAALAALWMLWMDTLHPRWRTRSGLMAVYVGGLLVGMLLLVLSAPWFGLFAWSGFLITFRVLTGGWRFAGMAAVAVILATAQSGGYPLAFTTALTYYLIMIAINVCITMVMGWLGLVWLEHNARRKQALADLAEANAKLEAAMRENAGLHAQLLTQAREAGVLDERHRLAREIHDTLAQGFTGVITQLEAVKLAPPHSETWQVHLERAERLARESLSEARRSVQALRPEPLEDGHLPEAIAAMAQHWAHNAAIGLSVQTIGESRPLLAEIEVILFRVAQESLTNVAKHARASRVGVTLSYLDDVVLLDVRDDGIGFSPAVDGAPGRPDEGRGFGLSAMRQRVQQVAGTLSIESAPGEGTAISASVPALVAGGGT